MRSTEEFKRHGWNLAITLAWVVLLVGLCIHHAFGAEPETLVRLSSVEVMDGDTIRAAIELPAGVSLERQPIRASNFDAWETARHRRSGDFATFTDAQWEAEITKGKAAKDFLALLLVDGTVYVVIEKERDTYGRLLGKWYVYRKESDDLIDVGKLMREHGHTRN